MELNIFWMNVAAVFAFVNIALVIVLGALYFQSWRRMKSSLSMSLLIFAAFFLVQNVIIVILWSVLYSVVPDGPLAQSIVVTGAPYLVAINAFEALALGNLVRVTWA